MYKQSNSFHSSEVKKKIDEAIEMIYAGGTNNSMDTIEQISYLLFLKTLKDTSLLSQSFNDCYWDYLINIEGSELVKAVQNAIEKITEFPDMPQIGKTLFDKATLKVVDPMTLKAVMHVIDGLSNKSISENDVTGDAYEYLLNKLSASGINGQFRTPSHIIDLIVKLVDPKAGETICDPACGSGGFLISSLNHISDEYNQSEFTGLDNDLNMVKIAALNLYARGVQKSNIAHHNTITTPFAGEYAKKKILCDSCKSPIFWKGSARQYPRRSMFKL